MLPFPVLGVLHGQAELEKDVKFSRDKTTVRLGSGIAIAIPGEEIYDVLINNRDLRLHRTELLDQRKNGEIPGASPHSNEA
jgi:hypothetical protein